MPPSENPSRYAQWPAGFWLFFGFELLCVGVGVFFLTMGRNAAAAACVLGPLQVLAWIVLLRKDYYLLLFFSALIPFACLELLPTAYVWLVLYASTLGFVLLMRAACSPRTQSPATKLVPSERVPLQVLAVCIVVSGVVALLRGWFSFTVVKHAILGWGVILTIWAFAVVPRSVHQVRLVVYALAAASVLACVSLLVLPGAVNSNTVFGGKTIVSVFSTVNLNAFATMVAVMAAIQIGTLLDARRMWTRIGLLLGTAVLLAVLVYTKSRGAWLGFGCAFLYLVFRGRSKLLPLLGLLVLAAFLSMETLRLLILSRATVTGTEDPSLLGRFLLWKYAWIVFKDNWVFGVGLQNFAFVKHFYGFPWPKLFGSAYNAHNLFLEILVDLGVIGFVAFVGLIVGSLVRLDRVVRRHRVQARGLSLGLGAGIIAYSVHGLLDCVIWQDSVFMLLGVVLGLAMCLRRLQSLKSTLVPGPG